LFLGVGWSVVLACTVVACGGATLDAGYDIPRGLLPVDERNPIVLCNDGSRDNWQGEYAVLLASTGGLRLSGIVISDSQPWPTLADNMAGWRQMVVAARDSGLHNIPNPVASTGPVLVRPSDGYIDSTATNRSEGATAIVEVSRQLAQPFRPLVVVTGGRLTDLADAYLMDHTVPERVVVVSALGTSATGGGLMGDPNGAMDPWASFIVVQKFRYVQVSAFYEQASDFPASALLQLPTNAFTSWIKAKQPNVWRSAFASDQVSVLAVAIPDFVSEVNRMTGRGVNSDNVPILATDPDGSARLVSKISSALGTARLWTMLLDPTTFRAQ